MVSEYIDDLFTEGLGDIFFMKFYRYLKKNIKNDMLRKILINVHGFFYIIFLLLVAVGIFVISFPF